MRDFEQRKAEIFRRSERRIAQRKRRSRIIISCVPLVVCIAVLSFFKLPAFEIQGDKSADEKYNHSTCGEAHVSVRIHYVKEGAEYSGEIKDRGMIEKISHAITAAKNSADSCIAGALLSGNKHRDVCIVTFISDDGNQTVYTISGNILTDSENRSVLLTDKQLSEIVSLLTEAR